MLFFLDESGTDHKKAPYEVLGAIGVPEQSAWKLIQRIQAAQRKNFGLEFYEAGFETKGTSLLKTKVFKNASMGEKLPDEERMSLTRSFLLKGKEARESNSTMQMTRSELIAYSQACLAYVRSVLSLCEEFRLVTFAAFVHPSAPRSSQKEVLLSKDLSSLFKWFYHCLEERPDLGHGLLVFDETGNVQSRRLLTKMRAYFVKTQYGRRASRRILPEPLFVHSDLTSLVQVADIMCYCLNWAYRMKGMDGPVRTELRPYAKRWANLRWTHSNLEEIKNKRLNIPAEGFNYFADLRPAEERRT